MTQSDTSPAVGNTNDKPTGCLKLSVRWLASKDVAKRLADEKNYNSR
jgi:hypothetical protein